MAETSIYFPQDWLGDAMRRAGFSNYRHAAWAIDPGMDPKTLADWDKARRPVPRTKVAAIAWAFRMPLSWFPGFEHLTVEDELRPFLGWVQAVAADPEWDRALVAQLEADVQRLLGTLQALQRSRRGQQEGERPSQSL